MRSQWTKNKPRFGRAKLKRSQTNSPTTRPFRSRPIVAVGEMALRGQTAAPRQIDPRTPFVDPS